MNLLAKSFTLSLWPTQAILIKLKDIQVAAHKISKSGKC